jgi:ribonuclease D
MEKTTVIKTPGLLSSATELIELAKQLESEKIIAFDTEFIRESTFYPIVEIIQVANPQTIMAHRRSRV